MKKVCILGTAETLREAPFHLNIEFWALNDMYKVLGQHLSKISRWFEIHKRTTVERDMPEEIEWLKSCKISVYMQEHYEDIPTSTKYPLDEIISNFGRKYFKSTVDYMIALALYEGYEEIHVYGVNMSCETDEYSNQKPSGSYWLGRAEGMGVKIYLPDSCDLLKGYFCYGYDEIEQSDFVKKGEFKARQLEQQAKEFQKNYYLSLGAKDTWDFILKETKINL